MVGGLLGTLLVAAALGQAAVRPSTCDKVGAGMKCQQNSMGSLDGWRVPVIKR